jgi:hypothetical protein
MKKSLLELRTITQKACIYLLFIIIILCSHNIYSQSWSNMAGGMNDWVFSSVVYQGELIVGGKFTSAGGVDANYIAKWDGSGWSPLGTGMNGKVNALTVYNGFLVAGGEFTMAGGLEVNFIAQWDGTSWSDELGGVGSTVAALTIYGTDLIVGGYFIEADNLPVNYIAKRNGNGWSSLGSGMSGGEGQVMALTVYNNELIAGGFFITAGGVPANHIAKWNGTSWSSLGTGTANGISNIVYSLTPYGTKLVAGGLFLSAGGVPANHIAMWNGSSWSALGSGMAGIFYQYVLALTVYNGDLVAGGYFTEAGGSTVNGIAKWDGSSWSGLNGGFFYGGSNVFGSNTLCVYGTDLIAGGLFSSAGSTSASHIASWNSLPGVSYQINLKAILEGFYTGINMKTDLNTMLPLSQPYTGIPWNYPGTEEVGVIPSPDVCDWVLIELRDALDAASAIPATRINIQAAFILIDGSVVGLDGLSNLILGYPPANQLFAVIWHRNHLPVMSAFPLNLNGEIYSYDFTLSSEQAFGNNAQKDLGTGVFGFYGGDANGDGAINNSDATVTWFSQAGSFDYLSADCNEDTQVDNKDKNEMWLINKGEDNQVPN